MQAILFSIGPFNVYTFGILLFVAFIISTFVLFKYAKEELKEEAYMDLYVYTCIVSFAAARIVYILANFSDFGLNLLRWFLVRETPGLSLIGGLSGGLVFLVIYSKNRKMEILHSLDIFSIVISSALIFIKIGEQLGGASFGRETKLFTGINILGKVGKFHPVEIYEALGFLIIFLILTILYSFIKRNKWSDGIIFNTFILLSALSVFILEFFKQHSVYLYKLDITQVISFVVIIFALIPVVRNIIIIKLFKKEKKI
jgi:phosphatidylglycerol---prolipoprotein diacylglyceryl transferase